MPWARCKVHMKLYSEYQNVSYHQDELGLAASVMDMIGTGCKADWIQLARNRAQCQALLHNVTYLPVS